MSEWMSVKDGRPSPGEVVLCLMAGGQYVVDEIVSENNGVGWHWMSDYSGGCPDRFYTHWMPLPAPPVLPPTKDEALREAIALLERVRDLHDGNDACVFRGIRGPQSHCDAILPRLRAALGET